MNNLQEVQKQITEMIKSDYPKPIFKYNIRFDNMHLDFQFDELSWHGEIEIYEVPNEGIFLESTYSTIEDNNETVEKFMNEFKEVYKEEQRQLEIYVESMSS